MTLDHALRILTETHTRDDTQFGFTVEGGITSFRFARFSQAEHIEAWRTVRAYLGLPVDPVDDKV